MTTTQTALLAALDSLSARNSMVTIASLRAQFPGAPRESFDLELNNLRRARILTCDASDGRHVRLTEADRAGGIEEDGQVLVYVARRDC